MAKTVKQPEPEALPILFPLMGVYPPQHWILYGDFGAGKSTMAASFHKAGPMLVHMFDPYGKDMPYLKVGTPTELQDHELGFPWRSVLGPDGEELIRLEYFLEFDPNNASMWNVYLKRFTQVQYGEYQQWSTYVLDSQNSMELTARYFGKKLNPPPKFDQRHWFGYSVDALEQILCSGAAALPINVVLICHSGEDKDEVNGTFVRSLHARGRLGDKRGLATMYSEIYRVYVGKDEQGNRERMAQTQSDNFWAATTQIGAPDPSWPDYESIWEGWQK